MTLATEIRILTPLDHLKVFNYIRSVLDIPEAHPYKIRELCGRNALWSQPGGFDSMVIVGGLGALADWQIEESKKCNKELGPLKWQVFVNLDTTYNYKGKHGSCSGVHNFVVESLLTQYPQIDLWACNEYEDTWHHNTLPY